MELREHINEKQVAMTTAQIRAELETIHAMLDHAYARQRELYDLEIPRDERNAERRRLRGNFLNRINNDIDNYNQRAELLASMLAGMEG